MTWIEGRKLDTVTVNGQTYTYVYNSDGQRVKKINPDGSYIEYYVMDGVTVGESHFTATGNKTLGIRYTFDENSNVIGFTTGGQNYYFIKNLQSDVLAVYRDADNAVVAEYTYDSWGNVLTATGSLAEINPFRYRSYYYDEETDFYYISSRYYDPEIGRWINADTLVSTGQGILGNNMFAYCLNNPVNYVDPAGTLAYPGEIHNEVVRRIADKYGYSKEQFILYKGGGFGRADLISSDGQVWDVKRDKPRQIKAGKKQVTKYVENTWARFPGTPLSVGGSEIESGYFYHKSGLTTYKVTYRYAGDGIIAYDYRVSDFDFQKLAEFALLVGIGAALGIITAIPSGGTAYLPLR